MIIPDGVNYTDFYNKCKEKGIKITSRYQEVCLITSNFNTLARKGEYREIVYWRITFKNNKGKMVQKNFPFTREGERAAYFKLIGAREVKRVDKANKKEPPS